MHEKCVICVVCVDSKHRRCTSANTASFFFLFLLSFFLLSFDSEVLEFVDALYPMGKIWETKRC